MKDKDFVLFLEKVAKEKQILLSFEQIYELECIREHKAVDLRFKDTFLDLGIIERVGRTSGAKYILSHAYYKHAGKPGIYTRIRGVSRKRNKELIVEHVKRNGKGYMRDFADIFPDLTATTIHNLLQELKRDEIIRHEGTRRTGYWVLSGQHRN